jgi:hypothetical protein
MNGLDTWLKGSRKALIFVTGMCMAVGVVRIFDEDFLRGSVSTVLERIAVLLSSGVSLSLSLSLSVRPYVFLAPSPSLSLPPLPQQRRKLSLR